jgi:hypothetical protein
VGRTSSSLFLEDRIRREEGSRGAVFFPDLLFGEEEEYEKENCTESWALVVPLVFPDFLANRMEIKRNGKLMKKTKRRTGRRTRRARDGAPT